MLRSTIEKSAFDIGVSKVSLTVSIGIATTIYLINPDILIKNADVALHKAKETKNVVITYEQCNK